MLCRLNSHSVGANSLARVNSVMRRWPRTARSTSVALMSIGSTRSSATVPTWPGRISPITRNSFSPGPGGHELGNSRDRSVRGRVGARPPMQGEQGDAAENEQAQGQSERQRSSRERPRHRPAELDVLGAGHRPRREPDLDLDDLTLAAGSVPEGGDLSSLGTGRRVAAGHLGVGTPGHAVDVGERSGDGDAGPEAGHLGAQPLEQAPLQSRSALGVDDGTGDGVAQDDLIRPVGRNRRRW